MFYSFSKSCALWREKSGPWTSSFTGCASKSLHAKQHHPSPEWGCGYTRQVQVFQFKAVFLIQAQNPCFYFLAQSTASFLLLWCGLHWNFSHKLFFRRFGPFSGFCHFTFRLSQKHMGLPASRDMGTRRWLKVPFVLPLLVGQQWAQLHGAPFLGESP